MLNRKAPDFRNEVRCFSVPSKIHPLHFGNLPKESNLFLSKSTKYRAGCA